MKKILLDTNFLLAIYQFKVDIFTQIDKLATFKYEIIILDKTLEEIKYIIKKQKGKNKDAAKIALKILSIKKIKILKTESNEKTDDIIIETAMKHDFIVATQDKDLKRILVNHGIAVIILRKKKILSLVNDKGFA